MAKCPLLNGDCLEHGCKFWLQVMGKNPNTGQDINAWDCAIVWMPVLLIENSQQQRQTGAAVESFRNEMVRGNQTYLNLAAQALGQLESPNGPRRN